MWDLEEETTVAGDDHGVERHTSMIRELNLYVEEEEIKSKEKNGKT